MNERVIEKYGRINIFANYGFCVFHLWKSIFNQPKFGTTQWNTPGSKGMPLWRSVFTSEGLIEHKRAKHEFRYSCTECPNPVIFARKPGLLGHTRKYHSRKPTSSTTFCAHRKTAKRRRLKVSFFPFFIQFPMISVRNCLCKLFCHVPIVSDWTNLYV